MWLNTVANCRVHGTTGDIPFIRLPREGLQSAEKAQSYDTSVLLTRHASRDCTISYEGNLYSVPAAFAQKALQVHVTEARVLICSEQGQQVARHQRLLGTHQHSIQTEHYHSLRPVPPHVPGPSPQLPPVEAFAPAAQLRFSGRHPSSRCVRSPSMSG